MPSCRARGVRAEPYENSVRRDPSAPADVQATEQSLPGNFFRICHVLRRRRTHAMTHFGAEPIRAELLSVERLEELAETIARHRVSPARQPGPRAAVAHARKRTRAASLLPDLGRGHQRRARDDTRGRVARGQLPHRRGGAHRDSHRSAAGLLSPAARRSTRGRSPALRARSSWRGPSSRTPTVGSIPRPCSASCWPFSAPSRCASASCGPCRSRSVCPDREPAPARRRDRREPRRAARGRPRSRISCWGRPSGRPIRRRSGTLDDAALTHAVRGAAGPAPARSGPGRHAGARAGSTSASPRAAPPRTTWSASSTSVRPPPT